MIYNLLPPDNPILRIPLSEINFDNFEEVFHITPNKLYEDLVSTMNHYKGIGLSANQCGLMIRAFVMFTDLDMKDHKIFFNPKITSLSGKDVDYEEGCLTYPNLFIKIKRPFTVEFSYQDERGDKHNEKYTGLTSRIFQHEYDHMEGKNFTQLVSPLKRDIAKRKAVKQLKKSEYNARNTR